MASCPNDNRALAAKVRNRHQRSDASADAKPIGKSRAEQRSAAQSRAELFYTRVKSTGTD
jgi:hypothetical protein